MNLWSGLETIVRPVDIDLLKHYEKLLVVGTGPSKGEHAAPILSRDSTIGLRRGRAQESAPPSDSTRNAC